MNEFYFDDECFEQKESDQYSTEVQALIDKIKSEVKSGILYKIKEYDKLKLQYDMVYKEKQALANDVRRLKLQIEGVKSDYEKNYMRMKIADLFKDYLEIGYWVGNKYVRTPKCNHCDERRDVIVTLPSGKSAKVKCDCDSHYQEYHVVEVKLYRFDLRKNSVHYRYSPLSYEEGLEIKDSCRVLKSFDKATVDGNYSCVYESKEEAQKHADYLNERETKNRIETQRK